MGPLTHAWWQPGLAEVEPPRAYGRRRTAYAGPARLQVRPDLVAPLAVDPRSQAPAEPTLPDPP